MKSLNKILIAPYLICTVGGWAVTAHPQPHNGPLDGGGTEYARALADAKKAGLPIDAKDLQAPLPPPQQNAAPIYTQLDSLLKAHPISGNDRNMEELTAPLTTEKVKLIRSAQQRRSDIMAFVHQAAARPSCVFVRDWSNPLKVTFPEFRLMRMASRLLKAESLALAWEGKPLEAVRNQALGFQIARQAALEHMVIGDLVGRAVNAITLAGMQQILYQTSDKSAVADAVGVTIEKEYHPFSLARTLRSELAMQVSELRMLRQEGPNALAEWAGDSSDETGKTTPKPTLHMDMQTWNRFVDANGLYILREMRKMIDAADRPSPEANHLLNAIATEIDKADSPQHLICTVLLPVSVNLAPIRARDQAEAGVTVAGAALLAWKSRHGSFPTELGSAMQRVPADPYDGKPLRYRRQGTGFVVYSIGQTGKFDGGVPDKKPANGEVRFWYPQPQVGR